MSPYVYILVMAATIFVVRVLPLTLIRKPIQSQFLRSFITLKRLEKGSTRILLR